MFLTIIIIKDDIVENGLPSDGVCKLFRAGERHILVHIAAADYDLVVFREQECA